MDRGLSNIINDLNYFFGKLFYSIMLISIKNNKFIQVITIALCITVFIFTVSNYFFNKSSSEPFSIPKTLEKSEWVIKDSFIINADILKIKIYDFGRKHLTLIERHQCKTY